MGTSVLPPDPLPGDGSQSSSNLSIPSSVTGARRGPGPGQRRDGPGFRRASLLLSGLRPRGQVGSWEGCSHAGASSLRTAAGRVPQAESRGPAASTPTPTPAERPGRTAGVTLPLPNPDGLQVRSARSELGGPPRRPPRGACAHTRAVAQSREVRVEGGPRAPGGGAGRPAGVRGGSGRLREPRLH